MKTTTPITSETELWAAYQRTRSDEDRNALAEIYLPWVERIATKMVKKLPAEVQVDDLISFGSRGLLEAIRKFNPALRFRFTTFAARIVTGRIYDALRNAAQRPRLVMDRTKKMQAVENTLYAELGREPYPEETAERLGISHKQYARRAQNRNIHDRSLEYVIDDDGPHSITIGNTLIDKAAPDPSMTVGNDELIGKMVDFVLQRYSVTEALILRLYYFEHMRFHEIGGMMRRSESRICQQHTALLESLRKHFANAA